MKNSLAAHWARRSPKERALLAAVGAMLALAVFIALAWLPLERARTRLATELPGLRASVAQMRAEAEEVKRLRALPAREPQGSLASLVAAGALTQGLPGAAASPLDARRARVSVADAGWNAVVAWVERTQAAQGLSVDSATIVALPTAGRVRAELVVVRP